MCEGTITPKTHVEEVKTTVGVVTNCNKLNVRKRPHTNSEILCVMSKGDKVEINIKESHRLFYKITTTAGIEGFCMKEYIGLELEENL